MKKFNYIYLITNTLNNKIYIGKHSTDNLDDGYMGSGKIIIRAIKKYNKENFTKEYLAFCDTEQTLNYLERYYIKKYNSVENGYNITYGGEGCLGLVHTEKTKKILSEKAKVNNNGSKNPFWHKHHSMKSRQKISKTLKENYVKEKHPNYNKHLPKSTKDKIGASNRGKTPWNKGKKDIYSDESKYKMSVSHKGLIPINKGVPQIKYKWLTSSGEIKEMDENNVKRWHPDWIKIGEV